MAEDLRAPATIAHQLGKGTRFHTVHSVSTTGSTNADVADWARAGGEEGLVLISGSQTNGRGRRDRSWESPDGKSISMSMLLRPGRPLMDWGWLSLLAGMAVATGLRDLCQVTNRIMLKWPNDVLIDGGKVCGILSERIETSQGPAAVVGIGINLSLTAEELPVPGATSLTLCGLENDRDRVANAVLESFDRLYGAWLRSGPPLEEYRRLCASIGAELTITVSQTKRVSGTGFDIGQDGQLMVHSQGGILSFAAGDVVHARLD